MRIWGKQARKGSLASRNGGKAEKELLAINRIIGVQHWTTLNWTENSQFNHFRHCSGLLLLHIFVLNPFVGVRPRPAVDTLWDFGRPGCLLGGTQL